MASLGQSHPSKRPRSPSFHNASSRDFIVIDEDVDLNIPPRKRLKNDEGVRYELTPIGGSAQNNAVRQLRVPFPTIHSDLTFSQDKLLIAQCLSFLSDVMPGVDPAYIREVTRVHRPINTYSRFAEIIRSALAENPDYPRKPAKGKIVTKYQPSEVDVDYYSLDRKHPVGQRYDHCSLVWSFSGLRSLV